MVNQRPPSEDWRKDFLRRLGRLEHDNYRHKVYWSIVIALALALLAGMGASIMQFLFGG